MKISKLALTITATAALTANRFVSYAGGVGQQDQPILGVAAFDAEEGADLTVDVTGVFYMPAGSPINQGDLITSNEDGQPIMTGKADTAFGRALTSAANPGDTVKILQR